MTEVDYINKITDLTKENTYLSNELAKFTQRITFITNEIVALAESVKVENDGLRSTKLNIIIDVMKIIDNSTIITK